MSTVLRIPRTDDPSNEDSCIILKVKQGGKPGDWDLVGTEGQNPYHLAVKQKQIHSFRADSKACSKDEWEKITESIFLQTSHDAVTNIEIVGTVEDEESIVLVIRRNVEGLTTRLGTFILNYDESTEISLFDWVAQSCEKVTSLLSSIVDQQQDSSSHATTIAALQAQIDDLIATKEDSERTLIDNFTLLLNEKKAKIRDQQRLLATAKIDPVAHGKIAASRKREAGPSRPGKRKGPESDEESEDGFENVAMDIDEKPYTRKRASGSPRGSGEDEGISSDHVSETADEATDSDAAADEASSKPINEEGRKVSSIREQNKKSPAGGQDSSPPPLRELPFQRKEKPKSTSPAPSALVGDDGEATASEDDEL